MLSPETNKSHIEQVFHDNWAKSESVENIDVVKIISAATSPEFRHIFSSIKELKGKRVLDVGSGLGEAGVGFALRGAQVTACDISPEMLLFTQKLAEKYGLSIAKHQASENGINLPRDTQFDIIYLGNLLHHVDIEKTVLELKPHLAEGGIWVSWDPLLYNPIINLYRLIATKVRTPDEHPFTFKDVRVFTKNFKTVKTNYFWLTTLIIFILMVFVQQKNPNKVRLWKKVIDDSAKWEWLYYPLEKFDAFLLKIFPPLKWLCWNILIIASNEKKEEGV